MSSFIPSRPITVALAVLPVSALAYAAIRFQRCVSELTTTSSGHASSSSASSSIREAKDALAAKSDDAAPSRPFSLPSEVASSDDSEWVVSYERVVSKPISQSALTIPVTAASKQADEKQPSPLMKAYSRAAHLAFARTPQAFMMRLLITDHQAKRSFDTHWIEHSDFKMGDVVNGVYKVTYQGRDDSQGSERVELLIEAPASYKGDVPKGLILAEIRRAEGDDESVVFINETWMWRRKEEPKTLIETPFGAWFHALVARWLVVRGVRSVTEE